jgi:hypothetical protein
MKKLILIIILLILAGAGGFYIYSKSKKSASQTVNLYYYNPQNDKDESGNILCSRQGLVSVKREVGASGNIIEETLNLLLEGGLTQEEKTSGITTEYPLDGFSMKSAVLQGGVLTLTFDDPNYKSSGGACRAGILWFQIEETAKQFPGVSQVRFLPEELFQP